jgi:hypothetical protein
VGEHQRLVRLFPPAAHRVDFCVGHHHISQLEQAITTHEECVGQPFRGVRRLSQAQHFCCNGEALLGVLRPYQREGHSQEAVGDQLRVVKAPGHRHRLRGVYHQLLPFPRDPQYVGQTAEGSRLEGTVFCPESPQRFLEQANR